MALEHQQKLTLSSPPQNPTPNPVDAVNGNGDDGGKTPRLPRWTRQEILVLIQGKRVAESRVRRGRTGIGSGQSEPKWASVSAYCKRHGVNRGPVQCRKRWSNLAGDFKKIKEWENQIKEETESFWVMRNDLRRERKLPGFFDKEVYDILDNGLNPSPLDAAAPAPELALALPAPAEEEKDEEEAVFDSGRSAAAEDGLFSDFEAEETREKEGAATEKQGPAAPVVSPVPISEKQCPPFPQECHGQVITNDNQPDSNADIGCTAQEGRKRKRTTTDDEEPTDLQYQLMDILEKNGKMLTAQLEVQNTNLQRDREQRKDHAESLVAVLNKLADSLAKIADKL